LCAGRAWLVGLFEVQTALARGDPGTYNQGPARHSDRFQHKNLIELQQMATHSGDRSITIKTTYRYRTALATGHRPVLLDNIFTTAPATAAQPDPLAPFRRALDDLDFGAGAAL